MFKAIVKETNEEIIILDHKWVEGLERLRRLDRTDCLVCQGCKQPVRIKAGQVKKWHFAHKHLQDCRYGFDSPALLKARAVLYQRLSKQFGDRVTLEKKIDSINLPRPIDCWIEKEPNCIAYWIIDSSLKAEVRQNLLSTFEDISVEINWLFTSDIISIDKEKPSLIKLSPTEREFACHTIFDDALQQHSYGDRKSLHYLDSENEVLITYRGLHSVHAPQIYKGHKESHSLSDIAIAPRNGMFAHPGEYEKWKEFKKTQKELEALRLRAEMEQAEEKKKFMAYFYADSLLPHPTSTSANKETEAFVGDMGDTRIYPTKNAAYEHNNSEHYGSQIQNREATCMLCGKKTREWWYFNGVTKLCKCNECPKR